MRITNIMISNRFGGIGQAYLDYNQALLERGHYVQAVCHYDGGWREATEDQMREYSKLTILTVKEKGGPKVIPSALKIRLNTKRFKPDIIVIHNYLHVGILATRGIAPQVSITHMYKCKHFEKLAGVIALTDELEALCLNSSIPKEQIRVIPNMIQGPFHTPRATRQASSTTIGGLGRLDSEKGFKDLIDAVSILIGDGHNIQLKLGGKGFEEDKLRAQVSQLGLEKHVEFLGFISDKMDFFEQLDVFVIPSHIETFGIIAIEAMKYGVPTVSTNVGGLNTIFRHEANALLTPPNSPASLAKAIAQLSRNPKIAYKLATQASIDVQQKYSLPVVSEQLESALLAWSKKP